jgi:UDP-N-acetylmuramyl tripeptide synthase
VAVSDTTRALGDLAAFHRARTDVALIAITGSNGKRYLPTDLQSGFNEKGYVVEADRQRAIQLGISVSRSGDTVLIAGKGHETYQILGTSTIAFDDREEARKALGAVSGQ